MTRDEQVAEYVASVKREYESLDSETLENWIQGHFEECRHAMLNNLPESAEAAAWRLHKMWQVVEQRTK